VATHLTSSSTGHAGERDVMHKRNMDTFKKVKRLRRQLKLMGFAFSLVGGILFISGIHLLANPDSTINCNGVVTTSISCKQNYTIFSRNTPGVVS